MALNLPGIENPLFKHSKEFDQGVGTRGTRKGASTLVVALDGSGDFDDIQEAINALPSTGGSVFIKEGTYIITKSININKSYVTIEGTGFSTEIKIKDSTTSDRFWMFYAESKSNISIKNLYLNGNGDNITIGGYFYGVYFYLCNSCRVENCRIEYFSLGDCIYFLLGSGKHLVTNCILGKGTYSVVGGGVRMMAPNSIISNNIIDSPEDFGILFQFSGKCTITGNIVISPYSAGIRIGYGGRGEEDVIVSGNVVSGSVNHSGIFLHAPTGKIIIKGNVLVNNASSGIRLFSADNCIVEGNICEGNAGKGLDLEESDNCIVNGNISEGNDKGLEIDADCDRVIYTGNYIRGNTTNQVIDNGTNTQLGHNITS